jgi:hypothetical protein
VAKQAADGIWPQPKARIAGVDKKAFRALLNSNDIIGDYRKASLGKGSCGGRFSGAIGALENNGPVVNGKGAGMETNDAPKPQQETEDRTK